jgi:orsellinic acid C2-O-methyltransferase
LKNNFGFMQPGEPARNESGRLYHELLELIGTSWKTQAVYVAAELRIADFLADRPKTTEDLAALTHANAAALRQLLRALTTIDICREQEDGTFAITPLGALLASNDPASLRSWAIWWGAQSWPVWGQLLYSVRTGNSARKLLLGTDGFAHLERDPASAEIFNRAAAELTRVAAAEIVRAYDFTPFARIVDVGGGCGELLAHILQAAPAARGVLFDLPHAIQHGRDHLRKLGLETRCEFVAGDFFETIPAGGDAYFLKNVIHDWNDESSRRILENCRAALGDGKLLLMECLLPDRLTTSTDDQAAVRSDLHMLVALAAKERTEAELRALLDSAGLRVTRVIPAGPTISLIEAVSASASA